MMKYGYASRKRTWQWHIAPAVAQCLRPESTSGKKTM